MSTERSGVVDTFMQIVQIDSPTFHEEEMAKEVFGRLKAMGLEPEIDKEGNVIARLEGDRSRETLMINAHLDTVEPGCGIKPYVGEDGWIRSEGETILGADNKTAVAAILTATERLVKEGVSHNPLEIVFTVSEESGNHGAHGLDYSNIEAKRGYIFDASDRNFGDMIISSPAYNRFDITIEGQPAHASRPEEAVNVIPTLANALTNTEVGRISESTIANIGVIQMGDVVNTVPGKANVSGEVRSMDETELDEYTQTIIARFRSAGEEHGTRVEAAVVRENGLFRFAKDEKFVLRTLKVLEEMGIDKPELIESWGCYEANIFAEHGIMMLNIADGMKNAHTVDETVNIEDLQMLADLVYLLVTK